ncbi:F-box domain - like 10 [Theobroma cacao]|nr:F-box domain - like 10 [Theobroma cacao]
MAETSNGTLAEQLLIDDSDVPDWLLTEILQRLPVKHIFMFKGVSRRWFTLISDPFFARSYATRINRSLSLSTSQPWNLLFRYLFEVRILPSRMIDDRVALNQFQDFPLPGFSLNFLPSKQDCPIKILALSNDDGYNVVRMPTADGSSNILQLETFSSETGQWHCSMVHCPVPDYYNKTDCPVVHYNGSLHWLEFRHSKIITYNPDKETSQLHLMNLPNGKESEYLSLLRVSRGHFRYFEDRAIYAFGYFDYDAQEWYLEYRIRFSDSWSPQGELNRFIPKDNFYIFPLPLHPHDFDIVYLGYGGCLVSYSLQTRKLEVLRRNFYSHQLLAFVLPPWPTRIPQPSW